MSSAGTGALSGWPMDPRAAAQLRSHGADPDGFLARQLTLEMVADADLVLTATRAHRAAVASMHPPALRYGFTLADFSDLASGLAGSEVPPLPDGRSWVGHVARLAADRRGIFPPRSAEETDLVDPHLREDQVFAAMAQQVIEALPPVVSLLTG